MEYDWPGNIRQLKNCIEQAIFYAESSVILPKDLPKEINSGHQMENSKSKSRNDTTENGSRNIIRYTSKDKR